MTSTDVTGTPVAAPLRQTGRLIAWCAVVGGLAALAYANRLSGAETPDDVLYLWSTAIAAMRMSMNPYWISAPTAVDQR